MKSLMFLLLVLSSLINQWAWASCETIQVQDCPTCLPRFVQVCRNDPPSFATPPPQKDFVYPNDYRYGR